MAEAVLKITKLRKRILEMVLAQAQEGNGVYGGQVARSLDAKSKFVYPALRDFESVGWLYSRWESGCRVYRLIREALPEVEAYIRGDKPPRLRPRTPYPIKRTVPRQQVLAAFLANPKRELYGWEIHVMTGVPDRRVYKILADLAEIGWLVACRGLRPKMYRLVHEHIEIVGGYVRACNSLGQPLSPISDVDSGRDAGGGTPA